VTIDGATARASLGTSFIVAPNVVHGVVAIEPGLLIDAFAPWRADFLERAEPSP
jgi:quercetin dioxygenase-like cupin family protein